MTYLPGSSRSMNRRQLLQRAAVLLPALHTPFLAATSAMPAHKDDALLPRQPDSVRVMTGDAADAPQDLYLSGRRWSASGIELTCTLDQDRTTLILHAPSTPIRRIHLRWHIKLSDDLLVLGDAWERSYGDLAWLPLQPERVLPWYCLLHNAGSTHGFGIATGAAALAFWQLDRDGLSLWLDVRNGGNGVVLGDRQLALASIVTCQGRPGESPFETTRTLCRRMAAGASPSKLRPSIGPLFGSNDWYYAYGRNTADGILRDAALVRELAPAGPLNPYTVIDDGYRDRTRFPDMARLAEQIRQRQVAPGIWVRPLQAAASTKAAWLLPASRYGQRKERAGDLAYDPTLPEAREAALNVIREACTWGYDLIKHDFTTYELLGRWGNEMGAAPTVDGWNFHDRSQTNAEIVTSLYRDLRSAAGDRIVLGCNTIGHLAVGLFDAQRSGDDVSGREWERTRRMGVNTLAFRLPQHGIFFATDADCIPITKKIPWTLTRQWLQAVASTGTVLLISPEPGTIGPEQRQAIRNAFSQCAGMHTASEPADWMSTRTPEDWVSGSARQHYDWTPSQGASPFDI